MLSLTHTIPLQLSRALILRRLEACRLKSGLPVVQMCRAPYRPMIVLEQLLPADVVNQPRRSPTVTISLDLRIQIIKRNQLTVTRNGCRSIQRRFNVLCARNGSLVLITYALIFGPILMNGRSFARCVARLLQGSMTANVTKDSIPERRSLFAKAS